MNYGYTEGYAAGTGVGVGVGAGSEPGAVSGLWLERRVCSMLELGLEVGSYECLAQEDVLGPCLTCEGKCRTVS